MAERTGKKKKTPMYADRIGGVRPFGVCMPVMWGASVYSGYLRSVRAENQMG